MSVNQTQTSVWLLRISGCLFCWNSKQWISLLVQGFQPDYLILIIFNVYKIFHILISLTIKIKTDSRGSSVLCTNLLMKTSLKKEHYGINSLINIQFVDTFAINNNDYMATFMIFQIHILDLHTLMRLFVSICINI